jgi:hypothetical protein
MALDNLKMVSAIVGTGIVLHRTTDRVDLTNPQPVDVATVLGLAYVTRMVVSS